MSKEEKEVVRRLKKMRKHTAALRELPATGPEKKVIDEIDDRILKLQATRAVAVNG